MGTLPRLKLIVGCLVLVCAAQAVWAEARTPKTRRARLQSSGRLATPVPNFIQQDSTLFCFEDSLRFVVNPGCFAVPGVQPGDCTSTPQQFFLTATFPSFSVPHLVTGFAFLSNDGDTVFPSAGVLLLPIMEDELGFFYEFPLPSDLANLQVQNIESPGDAEVVFVDVGDSNLIIGPNDMVVAAAVLQFPNGFLPPDEGVIGVGPGIAIDAEGSDPDCDFFTVDGGNDWYSPTRPGEPDYGGPIDWGVVITVEPHVAIQDVDWSHIKQLYRTP